MENGTNPSVIIGDKGAGEVLDINIRRGLLKTEILNLKLWNIDVIELPGLPDEFLRIRVRAS